MDKRDKLIKRIENLYSKIEKKADEDLMYLINKLIDLEINLERESNK